MSERTPGPWKLAGATHVFRAGENGANICSVSEPRASTAVGYTEVRLGSSDFHEACANADFIVRACNSHDALVKALKLALSIVCNFAGDSLENEKIYDAIHAALAAVEPKT